ncbi:MAG: hypothetical protein JNK75_02030 [Betaproteobacteria bacterium]|nr:hypothetical protein [Betaproteobacteria bacterium]
MAGDPRAPGDQVAREARGAAVFAVFDYAIKVAVVVLVVLGLLWVAMELSGADKHRLDEHAFFRFRHAVAFALVAGYLLIDFVLRRRRATAPVDAQPKPGHAAEWISVALVAAGGIAFWHDHKTHEIPKVVAVQGTFVSATCVDRERRAVVVRGPYMAIGYEYPSQSTSVRTSQMTCFVANCESGNPPKQYTDTEYKQVPYATMQACNDALPAVLAAKAPVTVWTGDKDPIAAVRARFTPERHAPPYFLLWVPMAVAVVVLTVAIARRTRRS